MRVVECILMAQCLYGNFSPVIHAGELNFNLHLGEFAYGQIN